MRSTAELVKRFRSHGLKVTPQRTVVFDVLQGDSAHPTAESVFEAARQRQPTLSLKTVYQTLGELARLGEISALDLGTGAARYDPNVETPHHHLVCDGCGAVRDVEASVGDLRVPASRRDFTITSAEVIFRGVCGACAASTD
ncbi:MAG TPA: Fur family transcriptional regulator [Acidimicrobiales bacterium]|nr:Fur family transcriptional regulator [Acidimicrobiales bacterium]